MKNKIFHLLKAIYKKMPLNYKVKNKLKSLFYRTFGFLFKNTTSYRVWQCVNCHMTRSDVVKVDREQALKYKCDAKIVIQMHLYYIDLLDEFAGYLKNIPYHFDVMVSIIDKNQTSNVREKLSGIANIENIYIETVTNRGRDVSPLLSVFGKKILEYDYVCHIHTKKSLFTGGEQTEWRKHLINGLLGTEKIVRNNLYLMEKGDNVGLIYPETFSGMPYQGHTWLKNQASRDELMERIGMNRKSDEIYIDYPMGTMFWAKVAAIRQFFEADIKVTEFPKEAGQTDGTIAHAFERCLGLVCRYNGYNMLIFDDVDETYAYNYGMKNMNQYFVKSYEHMEGELSNFDVISFDIFDTLLARKISRPDQILELVELKADKKYGIKSDFARKRLDAERSFRNKYPQKDADIDDIYQELKKISDFSAERCSDLKNLEISEEMQLIAPKKDMIALFKKLRHVYHKPVYLISDMQLRKCDIEKMLQLCGIGREDYEELLLSSEMNKRKDDGTMWEYFSDLHKGKKCIHIGDNEVSDVQITGDYGIDNYHVMSAKALYQLSDIGKATGVIDDTKPVDSIEYGLILTSMFSDAFQYNATRFQVQTGDAKLFGYNFIAPAVMNYVLWLVQEASAVHAKKILFFAREGYLFQKVYDIIDPFLGNSKIEGEYVYVSRKALISASLKDEHDIGSALDIYYEGKLDNLLTKRFGISIDGLHNEDIKLPDNKNKVLRIIHEYTADILEQAAKERQNYIKYLDGVLSGIQPDERIVVSDIGYSGTIQYYLSVLAQRGFDGRYMATDDRRKPLELHGNTIEGYYIDGDSEQQISKSNIHKYHLLLESILIAPDGQLMFINEEGCPEFEEKKNPLYNDVIAAIQEGVLEFTKDYAAVMQENILDEIPGKALAEQLISAAVNTAVMGKTIADSMLVDDKYCTGEIKNVVEYYRDLL